MQRTCLAVSICSGVVFQGCCYLAGPATFFWITMTTVVIINSKYSSGAHPYFKMCNI